MKRAQEKGNSGFTILEVILVLVLMSIMAGVAGRASVSMGNAATFQNTVEAMETMREKIIGNPFALQAGKRIDFGYWGHFGDFPATLAALRTTYSWIYPDTTTFEMASTDFWGNPYNYDGADGDNTTDSDATLIEIESEGANGDGGGPDGFGGTGGGGTGFNSDLEMTIDEDDFRTNEVQVLITDKNGMALLNGTHITSVSIISFGSTDAVTYNAGDGLWDRSNVLAGPARLVIDVVDDVLVGDDAMRLSLLGANGVAADNFEMWVVVYPKGGFATPENTYTVRLPGVIP